MKPINRINNIAEHVRIALRRPASSSRLPLRLHRLMMIGMGTAVLSTPPVHAVELPQACVSGGCGINSATKAPITWVSSGAATASVSGNTLNVNQSTETVTLNWASFNISADGKVIFSQPSTSSIALNRIFQESPSRILGSISTQLNSDAKKTGGQVYLVNPNGFIFGQQASVNAAGILVSTLGLSENTFKNGLLSAINIEKAALGEPATNSDYSQSTHPYVQDKDGNDLWFDASGNIVPAGTDQAVRHQVSIDVADGAKLLSTQSGGRVMLASQMINNGGVLTANDGQVILAAGNKVYIAAANQAGDPLRGLYVEVGGDGVVNNDLSSVLSAKRGDVSVIGMAINQQGRISASTSVSANGSVHLLARKMSDSGSSPVSNSNKESYWQPETSGTVTLGSQSSININIASEDGLATAVDAQTQAPSNIQIAGKQIIMQGGATIVAHGGNLTMHASADPNATLAGYKQVDSDARLRIDSGATIDLSGNNASRSVADNIVDVELRGSELADSPDQRNGALRGKTITVDARIGTPLADVSGAVGGIAKTAAQRTSSGGNATFVSTGDIVAAKDATIDVSGGQTTYTGAMVNTSQLLTADGKIVDIANAKEDVTYTGVVSPTKAVTHDRWGVIESVGQQTAGHYEAGYVQGSSAGTVTFDAPTMIMNATLTGHAVNGAYQRNFDSSCVAYACGGQLIIGENNAGNDFNYHAPSVTLSYGSPNIVVADDASISGIPLTLSTGFLRNGGFTRAEINSNDSVSISSDAALNLAAGSTLTIRASQINIDSDILSPAGKLDISSLTTITHADGGGIRVADNVQFNVSGQWVNDVEAFNATQPTTTLFRNAGSVSLSTTNLNGALSIGNSVNFIADAGAWLKSSGAVNGGTGGNVSLLSNGGNSSFFLGDGVRLSGYGVNGASGGTFSLSAGRIQITPRNTWADMQLYDPLSADSLGFFTITPKLFRDYGFSNFNIVATGGTLASKGDAFQIASGANINVLADTLLLSTQAGAHRSGDDIHAFASITTLPDYQRSVPSTVAFSVTPNDYANSLLNNTVGALHMAQGTVINIEPGSQIKLSTVNASIDVEGAVIAHAGSIAAHVSAPVNFQQTANDSSLGIKIDSAALLDTSGVYINKPSDSGLLQGILKDGGNVSLSADRGSVELAQGSIVNVSGASAMLDTLTPQASVPYRRETVASNAGNIALMAAESIQLDGNLVASGGQGTSGTANGGSLSIALSRSKAQSQQNIAPMSFSGVDRVVELTDDTQAGTGENGIARISVAQVQASGIDSLKLSADNNVLIDSGVNVSLHHTLQLDAPVIEVKDGVANLNAGYVSLGSSLQSDSIAATSGNSALNVHATNIDVTGAFALHETGTVNLISDGDIRLIGNPSGKMLAAADINLQASRVYASTATQFAIDDADHTVTITQGTASPGTPLSAASAISISAQNINQNGTLLAPFGTINLNAVNTLTLGANSKTSVSASGITIPYGFTDSNGKSWFYFDGTRPVTTLPDRIVTLNAGTAVSVAKNAVVDLSGGGDLYASEWIKGTGGSNDAFAFKLDANGNSTTVLTNPGLFAIVPALGTQLAPLDLANANVTAAQGLQVGDSIYLSASQGLTAGYYTLLPASYALLPGTQSYLVQAVQGFSGIQPGIKASLADGTPVVAGYRSFGDTGLGGASYSGYAIYPGSWGRSLAEYHDTLASSYFIDGRKTADAGQLSISTGDALQINGNVMSQASSGGRAASIDVSASNLQIVGSVGQGTTNIVQLQDSVLNDWHAGSLLLGGVRESDGTTVDVAANQVTVASNAKLSADEVILVATDKVSVQNGGSVQSTNATQPLAKPVTLSLKGDGADQAALVAVSSIAPVNVTRDNSAPSMALGQIDLAQGAAITSNGALIVDAPNGGVLQSAISGSNADWTISSSHLRLSDTATAGLLDINASIFGSMQSAKSVTLSSGGSIDFDRYLNGTLSLGSNATSLGSISLQAATLNNRSGQDVSLYADNISLQGITQATGQSGVVGGGTFSANAKSFNVNGQATTLNGFANTQLRASQQLQVNDNGSLSVGGDMNVTAARITAGAASNGALTASGNVQLSSVVASSALPSLALGGGLTIKGSNITDNANMVMSSGVVTLNADGLLTLGSAATIDVSGVPVYVAGIRADSSGGVIHLNSGGNLSAFADSKLNVSGSGGARAGTIDVTTGGALDLQSTLSAAAINATGGSISIDANSINNFSGLSDAFQQAGFTQQQSVHVNNGDLALATGKQLVAHDVQWVTDSGHVQIDGVINAPSTDSRSSIRLYGADGVTVNGQLHADGDSTTGRGGIIELGISTDTVNHGSAAISIANSVITADGKEQGHLRLRAPIVAGNDVDVSALPNDLSQLSRVELEAVSVMPVVDAVDWSAVKTTVTGSFNDLNANGGLQSRLLSNAKVVLSPGVDLTSEGDINLGAVDLYSWNINNHLSPVSLTVRAKGAVNVDGTISDGFTSSGTGTRRFISAANSPSATLRLVAGSNIDSADPLAIDASTSSDIVLNSGAIVRTGTGNLDLMASHDVTFNAGSSVYTGGNNSPDQSQMVTASTGASMSFLTSGGQLRINAANDVNGNAITQSVTEWQPRTTCTQVRTCATATIEWGLDLRQFRWNAGTLGGGDVSIIAGHDVNQLSVAAANSGIVNSSRTSFTEYRGGALELSAGNNINSGMIDAGGTSGAISAGSAVTATDWLGSTNSAGPVGLFVAMGNATVDVNARSGIALASIVNPTMFDFSSSLRKAYFFTYGDDSSFSASSVSGNVTLAQGGDVAPFFANLPTSTSDNIKDVVPANFTLHALSGDISTQGADDLIILYPSATGQLNLFAGGNIRVPNITMSDASQQSVSTPTSPLVGLSSTTAGAVDTHFGANSRTPGAIHVGDTLPAEITAGGDLLNSNFNLAKAARINIGRDMVDTELYLQNVTSSDVTEINVGRDILYTGQTGLISIGGPGRLDVTAGRDIDLGTSYGIESTGRLNNPNISDANGAGISLMAGLAREWDAATFVDKVIAKSADELQSLVSYMNIVTGENLSPDDALSAFKSLAVDQQRPFILRSFFAELVAAGRAYTADNSTAYKQGYAAIDALFPDSRSDRNPYAGDISMLFSRVYTLSGGDINMVVPGGKLDVGVAARPRSTTVIKQPGELGIVAQQAGNIDIFTNNDVSVNSSRIFTLGGGDIAIWSTLGNIDAGKGAKTSLSIPPPATKIDAQGNVTVILTGAVAGSGIRTIQTDPSQKLGNADLMAPIGAVDAGDAGIGAAGNINIAARKVVGAENINFGGQASGVPAATSGAGVTLAGASQTGGSSDKAVDKSTDESARTNKEDKAPIAQAALSWLEVFVTGLGEENCKQDDVECLKRQK